MKITTREDYCPKESLFSEKIPENPLNLFEKWYQKAAENDPNTANIMAVSTLGEKNIPAQRILLLKEIAEEKLIFYSNYESTKGKDLAKNPVISALFYWEKFKIQIHLQGSAEKISREKSVEYFQTRPLGSRISAIISQQSQRLDDYENLVKKAENERKKAEKNPKDYEQPPQHWGGYAITPKRWEFWQGQPNRLHQRIVYELSEKGVWSTYKIYP